MAISDFIAAFFAGPHASADARKGRKGKDIRQAMVPALGDFKIFQLMEHVQRVNGT